MENKIVIAEEGQKTNMSVSFGQVGWRVDLEIALPTSVNPTGIKNTALANLFKYVKLLKDCRSKSLKLSKPIHVYVKHESLSREVDTSYLPVSAGLESALKLGMQPQRMLNFATAFSAIFDVIINPTTVDIKCSTIAALQLAAEKAREDKKAIGLALANVLVAEERLSVGAKPALSEIQSEMIAEAHVCVPKTLDIEVSSMEELRAKLKTANVSKKIKAQAIADGEVFFNS